MLLEKKSYWNPGWEPELIAHPYLRHNKMLPKLIYLPRIGSTLWCRPWWSTIRNPRQSEETKSQEPRAKSQEPKLDTTKILAPLFRVNRWIMDAALNVAPPWNLTHIEALNKLSKWNNSTRIVQRTGTVLCLHLRKRQLFCSQTGSHYAQLGTGCGIHWEPLRTL